MNDAKDRAKDLIENGYTPIPIPHGKKGPKITSWQNKTFTPEDFHDNANVGLRCGDAGVAFLDLDIYCSDTVEAIIAEWMTRFGRRGGGDWMRRTGRAPKTGFLFRFPEPQKKMSCAIVGTGKAPLDDRGTPKPEGVEILGIGNQFVAFGMHPDTRADYVWQGPDPTDYSGEADDLPLLEALEADEFLAWVKETYGEKDTKPSLSEKTKATAPRQPRSATPAGATSVIEHFNANHPLADALFKYGYALDHGNHWVSPNSGTGSAAVEVIGERWRSLSGSDASAGVGAVSKTGDTRTGDAFDLYVHYEHGRNQSAAVKAYALRAGLVSQAPSEGEPARPYEALLAAAKLLGADDIGEMEALVGEAASLPPLRKDALFRTIKDATGITLGAIRQQDVHLQGATGELDHLDLAHKALSEIGGENILFAEGATWRWQDCGVWALQGDRAIKQAVQRTLGGLVETSPDIEVTASLVNGVTDVLLTVIYKAGHGFNLGTPESVNCLNGELVLDDLAGWGLEPHCRENYRTTQIPVRYDPAAKAPLFLDFLNQIFRDDADRDDKKALVLEMMGYTLMAHARHERFLMLIGAGANGKSVLLAVLEALCGPANVSGVQPSNFDRSFQRAHLHQKLANIVTELRQGEVIADAELKAITSGEPATVEHKFKDPFVMRPFATCWFGTNHMPSTRDFSDALFRRALILQFNRVFAKEEQDARLKDKLIAELPGILNLALSAYESVLSRGFTVPKSSVLAGDDWRLEADQVAQFVEDCATRKSGDRVASGNVYAAYKSWAQENGVKMVMSQRGLKERMTRLGFGTVRSGTTRYTTGLAINWPFSESLE